MSDYVGCCAQDSTSDGEKRRVHGTECQQARQAAETKAETGSNEAVALSIAHVFSFYRDHEGH